MTPNRLVLTALRDFPEIVPGDDLVVQIIKGMEREKLTLENGDVIVVTQKVVSKAEGCLIDLSTVKPSEQARTLAVETEKDPRHVEVILREGRDIIRQRNGVLIMETHHGWICANAGVDRSNVASKDADIVLTLPKDPDASAKRIREGLMAISGADVAVVITDSHGRAWRLGTVNLAIGVAGMLPIADLRGQPDRFGYHLRVTTIARADELAAAAGLLSGQAAEGLPVVHIRGASYPRGEGHATDMQRSVDRDLFR